MKNLKLVLMLFVGVLFGLMSCEVEEPEPEIKDPEATFVNNSPATIWVYYSEAQLTKDNWVSEYSGYVEINSGSRETLDLSEYDEDVKLYYYAQTAYSLYSPTTYLYWTGSFGYENGEEFDVSSDYFHLTLVNEGYSDLKGPEVFRYYGNGNDINDNSDLSYSKSVATGKTYEFGYFYQVAEDYGMAIGFWYTSSNYVFWEQGNAFSFTDENCAISFTNTNYKSNELSATINTRPASKDANTNVKVGTLKYEDMPEFMR